MDVASIMHACMHVQEELQGSSAQIQPCAASHFSLSSFGSFAQTICTGADCTMSVEPMGAVQPHRCKMLDGKKYTPLRIITLRRRLITVTNVLN